MKNSFYFSIGVIVLILIFAFILPNYYTYSYTTLNKDLILSQPSLEHIFGTDRLGRDVVALCMAGTKTSIIIGILSSLCATLIGLAFGITAGFFKGIIDKSIMVLIDIFLTFPTFFLLLALVSYIDASVFVLILIIFITGWMNMARLIRSESFKISHQPYIKILKLAKVNKAKIIIKYFAPILAPIFLISFSFGISGAILTESSLSFLGLGISPPEVSLGLIISEGKEFLKLAWWISFFPGAIMFLITFSFITISDYLQFRINAKQKQELTKNS